MEVFHLLVHVQGHCNGQGWAILKPGARSINRVSHVADRSPDTWSIFYCLSQALDQKWSRKDSNQSQYRMLALKAGALAAYVTSTFAHHLPTPVCLRQTLQISLMLLMWIFKILLLVSERFHLSPPCDKYLTKICLLLSLSDFLILNQFLDEITINLE